MLLLAVGLTTSVAVTGSLLVLTLIAAVIEGPKTLAVRKSLPAMPEQQTATPAVKRQKENSTKGFNFSDSICLTC